MYIPVAHNDVLDNFINFASLHKEMKYCTMQLNLHAIKYFKEVNNVGFIRFLCNSKSVMYLTIYTHQAFYGNIDNSFMA